MRPGATRSVRDLTVYALAIPAIALFGSLAWGGLDGRSLSAATSATGGGETCRFTVRAENNLSFDVWVRFTQSTYRFPGRQVGLFGNNPKDIKGVQDYRLRRGKKMDRRVEVNGKCDARREWTFVVEIGRPSNSKWVHRETKGWNDRTIRLGDSSCWANAGDGVSEDEC